MDGNQNTIDISTSQTKSGREIKIMIVILAAFLFLLLGIIISKLMLIETHLELISTRQIRIIEDLKK